MKGRQKLPENKSEPFDITFDKKWSEPTIKEKLIHFITDIWLCIKNFFYEKSFQLEVLSEPVEKPVGTWSYKVKPIGYTIRIVRIKIKTVRLKPQIEIDPIPTKFDLKPSETPLLFSLNKKKNET